jgi:hypothetical protein
MENRAKNLGETAPLTVVYTSSDINAQKQPDKNKKRLRRDFKDRGKVILFAKYISLSQQTKS